MNTNLVVHAAALSKVNGNNSLREGSSVFVRVIQKKGNSSYIVSFAGGRFSVKSELSLKEGTSFLAKIKILDGKIFLQKIDNPSQSKNAVQNLTGEKEKLFLSNLGLIPDNISFSLFNQMKQIGLKFDRNLFQKVRKIAENIKNKEKSAANTAFILEEKGITADEDKVLSIIGNSGDLEELIGKKIIENENCKNSFKEFFEYILNHSDDLKNTPGLLTLFNHLGLSFERAESRGNWIKVPFKFEGSCFSGRGYFSAFINNYFRELEKAQLYFLFPGCEYFFDMKFEKKVLKKIKVYSSDKIKNQQTAALLKEKFDADVSCIEDYCEFLPDESEISIVRGQV